MQTFESLQLSPSTLNAVAAMGFVTPTAVQSMTIPHLLAGRDIIAQARTGTGKTAAFGLPLVEASLSDRREGIRGIVALVLVPTRELALQVTEELNELAHGSHVKAIAVYGGVGFGNQVTALRGRGPLLLVATPGRLLDHIGQGNCNLDAVATLILDEADRMLDMGFLPDVTRIMERLPKRRQNGLFSATVPEPIRRLCQRFLHDPVTIRVETGPATVPLTEQFHVRTHPGEKVDALFALLEMEDPSRAIVFTRTKHVAKRLADKLGRNGWQAVGLQGNMSQGQRERAMAAFRKGDARILVATDVAGRGIDVPEVSHVVNFDIPEDPDAYVHRIGRTGRMGAEGRAFTFVQPDQERDLRDVERAAGKTLELFDLGDFPRREPPRAAPAQERPHNGRAHPGSRPRGEHRGPPRQRYTGHNSGHESGGRRSNAHGPAERGRQGGSRAYSGGAGARTGRGSW